MKGIFESNAVEIVVAEDCVLQGGGVEIIGR
jgi:hypothetical protein